MILWKKILIHFHGFSPFDTPDSNAGDIYKDSLFNPIMQYEQAYAYYKYLSMQMDYRIKCKEYEKLCLKDKRNEIQ